MRKRVFLIHGWGGYLQKEYVEGPKSIAIFFGLSFIFHLMWENAQAPLYRGYQSFAQHFWICLQATATGDMLFMLALYLALAKLHRDIFWTTKTAAYCQPSTWLLAIMIGPLIGGSYEFWAVHIAHRWAYEAMPLLPALGIGVTPVLQMIVVPLLVLCLLGSSTGSESTWRRKGRKEPSAPRLT